MQSLVVQQVLLGMHALLAPHAFCPDGHTHRPPGAAHVSPLTPAQSALVQHAAVGMHAALAPHGLCPDGHEHTPLAQLWPA